MNPDEIKHKLESEYPEINFTEFSTGIFSEEINNWLFTSIGESRKDQEIKTFFIVFAAIVFSEFDELSDILTVSDFHIDDKKYYYGEVGFCVLDNLNRVQHYYFIRQPSRYILRPFKYNEVWGFGIPGKAIIVNPKYQEVKEYSIEGLAAVKLNGKWGYIDKLGNEVIPAIYDDAKDFCDNGQYDDLSYVFRNAWSENLFKKPQKFRQQFAPVKLNNKWGYVNKQGEEVIPCEYDDALFFSQGYAAVMRNEKLGYLDRFGNKIIPFTYDEAGAFSDSLAAVKVSDRWGYVTIKGTYLIPPIYEQAQPFKENFALVQSNGKWGYIDYKNNKFDFHKNEINDFLYDNTKEAINGVSIGE